MRTLFVCLIAALAFNLSAQDEDYIQYETMYIKPDYKNLATLSENMKAHNDKYHSEAPYVANVWQIANGPDIGYLVWMMGPCTFAHLDERPAAEGHDDDWFNNVMPYITDMKNGEYWRRDNDLSTEIGEPKPNAFIRFHRIRRGKGYLLNEVLGKVKATVEAMDWDGTWSVYYNEFQQGDIGRHVLTVWSFTDWAELDEDPEFRKTFEEVHGADAWDPYVEMRNDVFEDSYDEIWSRLPSMSATVQED